MHQHVTFRIFHAFQRFLNRLWLAGQVKDQRLLADNANLTRKNGRRYKVQAHLTHLLTKAGHHPIGNRQRRIRSDVTTGRARAAGSQHQMAAHFIHQLAQCLLNNNLFIRDQAGLQFERRGERAGQPRFKRGDAFILIDAAGGAIGNGN